MGDFKNKYLIFIYIVIILVIFNYNSAFAFEYYSINEESFSTLNEAYNYIKNHLEGVGTVSVLQDVEETSILSIGSRDSNDYKHEWTYYNVITTKWNK